MPAGLRFRLKNRLGTASGQKKGALFKTAHPQPQQRSRVRTEFYNPAGASMGGVWCLLQDPTCRNGCSIEDLLIQVKFGCIAQRRSLPSRGESIRRPPLGASRIVRRRGRTLLLIHHDSVRRTLKVIKLAGTDRPPEQAGNHKDQNDRNRDQQVKGFQLATPSLETVGTPTYLITLRCNRSEFKTTQSELNDMPIPASQGVNRPAIATGRATAL